MAINVVGLTCLENAELGEPGSRKVCLGLTNGPPSRISASSFPEFETLCWLRRILDLENPTILYKRSHLGHEVHNNEQADHVTFGILIIHTKHHAML